MKKILAMIIISLLCFSVFSIFVPRPKADSAYLTNVTQLTTNPYDDRGAGWYPDSSKIAYSAFADSWYRNIWVMDSDGSNKKQLTFGNVVDDAPAYSPDGTQIVFMRYGLRGIDGSDLMMMNADGTNIRQLTSTGLHRGEPRWSHDGQRLAFYYGGAGTPTWEIHIMNADGTNEVTVVSSTSPEAAMNPAWSPDDTKLVYTMDDGLWTVNTSPPYQTTHVYQTSLPTTYAVYSPDGKYIMYASGAYGQLQDLYLIDIYGNFIGQLTFDTKFGYIFDWSPDGQYIAFNSISSGNYDVWRADISIQHTPSAGIEAEVDIKPDSLNLKSQGKWITAYIELPEGYNVADINVSTIMLNGTVPAESSPTAIGDYDNDGVPDLMVKFNRTAVSELILSEGIKYGNVTLTVSGVLNDETMFEGSDIIRVRMPGDVNSDGKVDVFDVVLLAARYGMSNPEPYYDMNEDGKINIFDIVSVTANYGKTYQ